MEGKKGPIYTKKREQLMKRKSRKPEESKTVRQWGLLGRIPVDGALPSYLWTERNEAGERYIRRVYFHEDNTREMTEEEQKRFMADKKAFVQMYVDMFYIIE